MKQGMTVGSKSRFLKNVDGKEVMVVNLPNKHGKTPVVEQVIVRAPAKECVGELVALRDDAQQSNNQRKLREKLVQKHLDDMKSGFLASFVVEVAVGPSGKAQVIDGGHKLVAVHRHGHWKGTIIVLIRQCKTQADVSHLAAEFDSRLSARTGPEVMRFAIGDIIDMHAIPDWHAMQVNSAVTHIRDGLFKAGKLWPTMSIQPVFVGGVTTYGQFVFTGQNALEDVVWFHKTFPATSRKLLPMPVVTAMIQSRRLYGDGVADIWRDYINGYGKNWTRYLKLLREEVMGDDKETKKTKGGYQGQAYFYNLAAWAFMKTATDSRHPNGLMAGHEQFEYGCPYWVGNTNPKSAKVSGTAKGSRKASSGSKSGKGDVNVTVAVAAAA